MRGTAEEKKTRRRKEIVQAAWELFGEKGFDATTIDDMTERAGLSHGTFYLYFSSKEDILRHLGEEVLKEMFEFSIEMSCKKGISPQERLFRIIKYLLSLHERQTFRMNLHDVMHRRVHDKLKEEGVERFLPIIESLLKEGVEAGQMKMSSPKETALFVVLLVAELEHGMDRWNEDGDRERASNAFRELLMRTLGSDENVFTERLF